MLICTVCQIMYNVADLYLGSYRSNRSATPFAQAISRHLNLPWFPGHLQAS